MRIPLRSDRAIVRGALVLLAAAIVALVPGSALAQDAPSAVGPLLKLYRSGRLPAERQPAVVEMICARGNQHDLRVVFDKVLEPGGMNDEVRRKALAGLADAAATRKVKPVGELAAMAGLIESNDAAVRLAAVRLAGAWRVAEAAPALEQIAADDQAAADLRRSAIAGLVSIGGESSRQTLLKLSNDDPSVDMRMQAAAGLVEFDMHLAAEEAARVLAAASPQDDPEPLLSAFFNRKQGSDALAQALEPTDLSVDVAKRALRTMYALGRSDAGLSNVLSAAAGIDASAPPPTPEEVALIVKEVAEKGDPARGERIFRRADLSCFRCHSLSRAGGQVGPELSPIGGSSPLDYIANSILNPNLAVKEQYVTKVFELSDGLVLSGVVIDRDETRVRVRDAQGKVLVIPTADIDDEVAGPSMMPQGITKFLTRDELLDLIRFVSELGKPGDFVVQTTPRIQRWQIMLNPPAELTAETPHLDHIRQYVLGSPPEAWTSVYATVAGALPLTEVRPPSGPQVVILRGEIQVHQAGPLVFDVSCSEPLAAWVDAQPLFAQPKLEAVLEPGRHFVVVRVEISDRSEPELRVELARPEGATTQFEVVGGM